jgi:hypothetical protein
MMVMMMMMIVIVTVIRVQYGGMTDTVTTEESQYRKQVVRKPCVTCYTRVVYL